MSPPASLDRLLRPLPQPSRRPWAGSRFGPGIGELWLAGPSSRIETQDGLQTLDDLARRWGSDLVGRRSAAKLGRRFPLLVKLIDAAERLSLQVHPDDVLARRLVGAGHLGKTEAWVILDADRDARLVTGPRGGIAPGAVRRAVADGSIDLTHAETHAARPGDAWLVPAGTMHAIGGGTFLYEIEQPSDITYRLSDWGRPVDSMRPLEPDAGLEALDLHARAIRAGTAWTLDGGALTCPHFRLELLVVERSRHRRPAETLEVLTVLDGAVILDFPGGSEKLRAFDTAVVPAAVAAYAMAGAPTARVSIGSIP